MRWLGDLWVQDTAARCKVGALMGACRQAMGAHWWLAGAPCWVHLGQNRVLLLVTRGIHGCPPNTNKIL